MMYQIYAEETSGIDISSVVARKKTRDALRGHWQEQEDFFQKFFPITAHVRRTSPLVKAKLYSKPRSKPKGIEAPTYRWTGITSNLTSVTSLYSPLNKLLNAILNTFKLHDSGNNPRLFIKTHHCGVSPDVRYPICPAILLAGGGPSFLNAPGPRPVSHYASGISPLEVVLEDVDMEVAKHRLATIVQEMFHYQPNRRFAFGLVISQHTLTCYLFDHAGVVSSPALNYHQEPDQFCALIAGLAAANSVHIGFDTTIFLDENRNQCIRARTPSGKDTASNITYISDGLMFHASTLLGRGTTCFLAHRQGISDIYYVIKDAWISIDHPDQEGRESESALLLHAQRQGVVQGVVQICHAEEVRLTGRNGRIANDSILNNRLSDLSASDQRLQRIHTRIVMSTYGKRLDNFSTRRELLLGYYDAVRAHRNLYDVAGILHRDIKPENILIKADGAEGDRGILIDFDHAIRVDNLSPYSATKKIGTFLFMSLNVLQAENPHGYMDDLESFYYVLIYIIVMFPRPQSPRKKIPFLLKLWRTREAYEQKFAFLMRSFKVEVPPWFGTPFLNLAVRLHAFFKDRLQKSEDSEVLPLDEDTKAATDEFLSYVRQAILELEEEESNPDLTSLRPDTTSGAASYPPKRPSPESSSDEVDEPQRRRKGRRAIGMQTVAALRTKRQNVNYG